MDSLYEHPAYYGMLHGERRSDLTFYLEATEGRAQVLEYGVGRGRVALPMARRGQRVLGVELSPQMLADLHRRREDEPPDVRERLRTIRGDATALELPERFDAITCPFNGIAHHLTLERLAAWLARVRQHLRPGGCFVFDVAVPNPTLLAGTVSEIPWFRDPRSGVASRATETIEYDPMRQVLTVTLDARPMEGEDAPVSMVLRMRQLFPQETQLLLRHHGFEVLEQNTDLGDVIGYVCRPTGQG